jgi:CheY-like chemotaxis protein
LSRIEQTDGQQQWETKVNVPDLMRWKRYKMPNATVNLLIVDDDAALRISLSHIFATFGHRVRCAADGFSALSELRVKVPDVILSDLNMPGMSGFEFLSVVRRRFPTVKVIAMSSAFAVGEIPPGVAADAFYQKGSNLGSLLQIMEGMTLPEPLSLAHSSAPAPIWVESNGQPAPGGAYITLTCPECLRAFPQLSAETPLRVHETNCIYCKRAFAYAIVEPAEPVLRRGRGQKQAIPPLLIPPERQAQGNFP